MVESEHISHLLLPTTRHLTQENIIQIETIMHTFGLTITFPSIVNKVANPSGVHTK